MFIFSDVPDSYYYRTVKVGQTVKFPCHTKLTEDVNWARLDTPESRARYVYYSNRGPIDLGHDPRFTVLDKNHSHSLVIDSVTVDDSAYYRCVEDSGMGNRHFYGLTVEGIFICIFVSINYSILHCCSKTGYALRFRITSSITSSCVRAQYNTIFV